MISALVETLILALLLPRPLRAPGAVAARFCTTLPSATSFASGGGPIAAQNNVLKLVIVSDSNSEPSAQCARYTAPESSESLSKVKAPEVEIKAKSFEKSKCVHALTDVPLLSKDIEMLAKIHVGHRPRHGPDNSRCVCF